MGNFFVNIYIYLRLHKSLRWCVLLLSTVVMALLSLQVEYEEDITTFFPNQDQSKVVFESLKAKDKFAIMFTAESGDVDSQYELMDCVEELSADLSESEELSGSAKFIAGVDDQGVDRITNFIYDNLPIFLTDDDYRRLEALITPDSISATMSHNYTRLVSPIGNFIADYIYRDPLGVGSETIKKLQSLGSGFNYAIIDNYLFSKDGKTLISYLEPNENIEGREMRRLIDNLEESIEQLSTNYKGVDIQYYGAPIVAEYNARQIKKDSIVTLNIALLLVIIVLSIAFRNRYSALIVLVPVVYGALFSLSIISLLKGSISLIAVGAGSVIFGIALSYSIHLLSHTLYEKDIKEVIRDLAYPLTVGSFTTIGAFAGLLFTSSTILQDLGLFASFTLIGTTIFVLVFSPHFMSIDESSNAESNRLIVSINRCSERLSKIGKPVIALVIIATLVCAFFAGKVGFDSNMMNLNFEPPHLKSAGERLSTFSSNREGESNIFFIASDGDGDRATDGYNEICFLLDSLRSSGDIISYSSVDTFVVSDSLREARIDMWESFWAKHNGDDIVAEVERSSRLLGFEDGAFDRFAQMLTRDYQRQPYKKTLAEVFPDWVNDHGSSHSYMAQVQLADSAKERVYQTISRDSRFIAADRAFFASKMAADVNHNFSIILYLSSALVFFAMLICYGRIEITLMAFTPMFVSWVIILGLMAMFGIEFNIVTIILSTFIFGIGDDFSIFMMDGLLSDYKDNRKLLAPHKTAILFSAFTVVVGMGALCFAEHPAMNSLGVISLLGILIVVLVSYTLQPALFRFFISAPTKKGGFPFTLRSLLNTLYAFSLFVFGCSIVQMLMLTVLPLPIGKRRRVKFVRLCTHLFCKYFLKVMVTVRLVNINKSNETFEKPAVIIANHQSFIDILMLLGLNRNFVMVTNNWVWNSPFFGRIVRYLGFFNTDDGYETIDDSLRERVKEGCSIIVFPEGTRSVDCSVKRFHKGAFYLAENLNLDIVPILIYGNGLVSSKQQGIYIKNGLLVSKILPRITADSTDYGVGYRERTKLISRYFRAEYQTLYDEMNRTSNPYFRDAIIKNYIYKGPVIEWYMRVKLHLEGRYDRYDRLLPREGVIVDLGCGYGAMSYMLSLLSNKRTILGVDYDHEKIALANNSLSKSNRVEFKCGDIREVELPQADAFVISDVLHYINSEDQRSVIKRCIDNLRVGGILVIKDGDSSLTARHANTIESERWSTQIIGFNKTDGELCFLSRGAVEDITAECGADVEYIDDNSRLSNVIFVITKR